MAASAPIRLAVWHRIRHRKQQRVLRPSAHRSASPVLPACPAHPQRRLHITHVCLRRSGVCRPGGRGESIGHARRAGELDVHAEPAAALERVHVVERASVELFVVCTARFMMSQTPRAPVLENEKVSFLYRIGNRQHLLSLFKNETQDHCDLWISCRHKQSICQTRPRHH